MPGTKATKGRIGSLDEKRQLLRTPNPLLKTNARLNGEEREEIVWSC
jgi:hypothetical protein